MNYKKDRRKEYFLLMSLLAVLCAGLILSFSLTGNYSRANDENCNKNNFCENGETNANCANDCKCEDLAPGNSYYIDPRGICGVCSDDNDGSVDNPWCTIDRAFNDSMIAHMEGGNSLYLRSGIHRHTNLREGIRDGEYSGIDGTQQDPTLIAGYEGDEIPSVYMSYKANSDWTQCTEEECDGKEIYYVDWNRILFELYGRTFNTGDYRDRCVISPGLIAIDNEIPIILNEMNGCYPFAQPSVPERTELSEIQPGDYYFNDDSSSEDYGKIYVYMPDESSPDGKNVEIGLPTYFGVRGNWITLKDLKFRYSSTISVRTFKGSLHAQEGSSHVTFDNIDAQYLDDAVRNWAEFGIINNSILSNNGYGGEGIRADNSIIENTRIEANNWKNFEVNGGGGMKVIADMENLTIRNCTFKDNKCAGLWLDWMLGGHLIENNFFINNDGTNVYFEVSGDDSTGLPLEQDPINKIILLKDEEGDYSIDLRKDGIWPGFIRAEKTINPEGGDFSAFARIKIHELGEEKVIMGTMYKYETGWSFGIDAEGYLFVRLRASSGWPIIEYKSTSAIDVENWHHVGFVISSGDKIKFYIDDSQINEESTGSRDIRTNNELVIGGFVFSSVIPASYNLHSLISISRDYFIYHLEGSIDDVTIHKRAITPSEVSEMYTNNIVNEKELYLWYNFDGKLARDLSGNYNEPSPVIFRNNVFTNEDDGGRNKWAFNIYGLGNGNLEIYNNLFVKSHTTRDGANGQHILLHKDSRKPGRPVGGKIYNNIFMNASTLVHLENCTYVLASENQGGDNFWVEEDCSEANKPIYDVNNNFYLYDKEDLHFGMAGKGKSLSQWHEYGYDLNSEIIDINDVETVLQPELSDLESDDAITKINSVKVILGINICNNNGVCDDGETTTSCPNDCISSCSDCGEGFWNLCDPAECQGLGDCEFDFFSFVEKCVEIERCNNNGTCDDGENTTNCPMDCISPPPTPCNGTNCSYIISCIGENCDLPPPPSCIGDSCALPPGPVPCAESDWEFDLLPASCPSSGIQVKNWSKNTDCIGGVQHPNIESINCSIESSGASGDSNYDNSPDGNRSGSIFPNIDNISAGGNKTNNSVRDIGGEEDGDQIVWIIWVIVLATLTTALTLAIIALIIHKTSEAKRREGLKRVFELSQQSNNPYSNNQLSWGR